MSRNISDSIKKRIAGKQFYKCANNLEQNNIRGLENYECPLWTKSNDNKGCFDESGYEVDHIIEWSKSKNNNEKNLQALCKSCHSVKTKRFLNKSRKKSTDDDNDSSNEIFSSENLSEEEPSYPKSKTPRKTTTYLLFAKKEIPRQIKLHPGLKSKDYIKLCAKEWRKYKEEHDIESNGTKKSNNEISEEISEEVSEASFVSSEEISSEEELSYPKSKTQKKPTLYQLFAKKEIPRLRKLHPGLELKEYMKLSAEEWSKYKKKNVSSEEISSEEELSYPKSKTQKKPTLYQLFAKKEIPRLRKLHPGLELKECMKLSAEEWSKYKKKNGIKTKY